MIWILAGFLFSLIYQKYAIFPFNSLIFGGIFDLFAKTPFEHLNFGGVFKRELKLLALLHLCLFDLDVSVFLDVSSVSRRFFLVLFLDVSFVSRRIFAS